MRRREFIALASSAVLMRHEAEAQPSQRMFRVAVLTGYAEDDREGQSRIAAFREGLKGLGWEDGRNLRINYRWAAGDIGRIRSYAAELVSLAPDVIVCSGTPVTAALQQATQSIPSVFLLVIDPVASGFVASLANPGGNITGFSNYEHGMGGKWLETLREVAPRNTRVLVLFNPNSAGALGTLHTLESTATSLGMEVTSVGLRGVIDIDRAFDEAADAGNASLLVIPDALISVHRGLIIARAARHRFPAIYPFRFFATDGGLMAYGVDTGDLFRRSADYVDRILKGAKPGDLPVQGPTKFEFVINLKTANSLGLTIPPTLLARADEVIE